MMRLLKLLMACLLLSGCTTAPTGVQMSEDERKACAAEGCTVWWTPGELQNMARHFFMEGARQARGRGAL